MTRSSEALLFATGTKLEQVRGTSKTSPKKIVVIHWLGTLKSQNVIQVKYSCQNC
jgi:hypothetical protein